MRVGEWIKQRRKELGLSADDVAAALGVDRSTIYRYESGDIKKISVESIHALAEILRTPVLDIVGWETDAASYMARNIPMLIGLVDGKPAYEGYQKYIEGGGVVQVDFCWRVADDSMTDARIRRGDIVFVQQQPSVENGDIAVVVVGDEIALRRFYKADSGVILEPDNGQHRPEFYTDKDFREIPVLGKVVSFQGYV